MSAHDISSIGHNLTLRNPSQGWRMTYGIREARVRSTHGLRPSARLRRLRSAVRRRSSSTWLLVSGSVSLHGVCATDLSRKPPRHRDVSAGLRAQALPCGLSWQGLAEHVGRCQPRSRLAHLRRLRSSVDRSSAEALCRRSLRRGTGTDRLRPRQHHDRPLPEPVSVGAVPPPQRGREAAHALGPARQHPLFRADFPRENRTT